MMNYISRLIGCHKLHISSFYSFLQRYLTSQQAEVTHVLAFAVQSCHEVRVFPLALLVTCDEHDVAFVDGAS